MPTSEPLHVAEYRSEGRFNFYIFIPSASHSLDAVIALLVGCANIHLRGTRPQNTLLPTAKFNNGWHAKWFYLKDVPKA